MEYENMNETIIARTAYLITCAKKRMVARMVFVGVIAFFVAIAVGATVCPYERRFWNCLLLWPFIYGIIILLSCFIYEKSLQRFLKHAVNGEYKLITGTMKYSKVSRYKEHRSDFGATGRFANSRPFGGMVSPFEYTIYVNIDEQTEVKLSLDSTLFMEYRYNRPILLIEWEDESRGLMGKYDFIVPNSSSDISK